jgi:hypothetical protein
MKILIHKLVISKKNLIILGFFLKVALTITVYVLQSGEVMRMRLEILEKWLAGCLSLGRVSWVTVCYN